MNPNVKNVYPVPVNGLKFVVMAFRQLTKQEMKQSIVYYFRTIKKTASVGSLVTITSILE